MGQGKGYCKGNWQTIPMHSFLPSATPFIPLKNRTDTIVMNTDVTNTETRIPETTQPLLHPELTAPDSLQTTMLQMVTGYWVAQSIYAAAKLGIADHLSDRAQSTEVLAQLTETDPRSLYRLLRALSSIGVFVETEPGWFALTPLATYLQSNQPGSIRDAAIMLGDPEHYASWGNLLHSLRTGESAFENLYGMNVFQHYAQNPQAAAVFDRAMTSFSSAENAGVVTQYDFSSIHTLVDVAGGHGSLLAAILQANPHLNGILFDQPAVVAGAAPLLQSYGVSDRCQVVGGSFFESVPSGADAYLLKHILHDWDDDRSIEILKQCRCAMAGQGRVLVVEQVIPPGNEPFMGKLLDMNMLVMCPGGQERTAAEYEALFEAAGFKLSRIVPTSTMVSIVEGLA
jgi:hypothetical protein